MRPSLVLAAAALACAAAATPSSAQEIKSPYCATFFAHGDTGSSSSCTTQGPPPVACMGCGVRRTIEVAVTNGAVHAVLHCDGYDVAAVDVTGPGTGERGVWGGQDCTVTIAATADATTAAVTSTASYVIEIA